MENKSLVWITGGGIGNIVQKTCIIPELKEKYDEIYVVTPYADIFEIQDIDGAFQQAPATLYSQLIKDSGDDVDVIAENVYNNKDFLKKTLHFNDAVRDLFGFERKGIEACMNENPVLPLKEKHPEVYDDVRNFLNQQKKHKFVVLQYEGGTSPLEPNMYNAFAKEPLIRTYKWYPELVKKLQEKYKDYTFIQYKLPQEKLLDGCVTIERPYLWWRALAEVLAEDKDNFAVVRDSSFQHMAAGTGLDTYVLFGETGGFGEYPVGAYFGHSANKNFSFVKNDISDCQPFFQAFSNPPAVVRYKKPDELIEEMGL